MKVFVGFFIRREYYVDSKKFFLVFNLAIKAQKVIWENKKDAD